MSDAEPKRRANAYMTQPTDPKDDAPTTRTQRTPDQWQDLISQRIEEAMRQGAFDNLRGKGRPLDPAPAPFVPPDMQMANALLKNNDLVPAWIGDRNTTLAAIEDLRARIERRAAEFREAQTAATPEPGPRLAQHWSRQITTWRTEIAELNKRIDIQNLKQPVTFLEIVKLRLEDELRRAGATEQPNYVATDTPTR